MTDILGSLFCLLYNLESLYILEKLLSLQFEIN